MKYSEITIHNALASRNFFIQPIVIWPMILLLSSEHYGFDSKRERAKQRERARDRKPKFNDDDRGEKEREKKEQIQPYERNHNTTKHNKKETHSKRVQVINAVWTVELPMSTTAIKNVQCSRVYSTLCDHIIFMWFLFSGHSWCFGP